MWLIYEQRLPALLLLPTGTNTSNKRQRDRTNHFWWLNSQEKLLGCLPQLLTIGFVHRFGTLHATSSLEGWLRVGEHLCDLTKTHTFFPHSPTSVHVRWKGLINYAHFWRLVWKTHDLWLLTGNEMLTKTQSLPLSPVLSLWVVAAVLWAMKFRHIHTFIGY